MSTSRERNASTHLVTFHHELSDLRSGETLPATIHTHTIWLQLCKSSKLWVVRAFLLCWFHSGRDCLSWHLPREALSSLCHLLFQKLRQYFSSGLWNLVLVSDFLGRQCPSFSDSSYKVLFNSSRETCFSSEHVSQHLTSVHISDEM